MQRTKKQAEMLEAVIRADIESMPYKFRDLREMFYGGIGAYKDISNEEVETLFEEMELEITEQDQEYARVNA